MVERAYKFFEPEKISRCNTFDFLFLSFSVQGGPSIETLNPFDSSISVIFKTTIIAKLRSSSNSNSVELALTSI